MDEMLVEKYIISPKDILRLRLKGLQHEDSIKRRFFRKAT